MPLTKETDMKQGAKNVVRKIESERQQANSLSPAEMERKRLIEKLEERMEEEKDKTEAEKRSDKFRRYIDTHSTPIKLEVKPAKKTKEKPGLQFEGTLKVLTERYKDIKTLTLHMTMGQLTKYHAKPGEENRLYSNKTGELVYDADTGECFE